MLLGDTVKSSWKGCMSGRDCRIGGSDHAIALGQMVSALYEWLVFRPDRSNLLGYPFISASGQSHYSHAINRRSRRRVFSIWCLTSRKPTKSNRTISHNTCRRTARLCIYLGLSPLGGNRFSSFAS